MEWIYIEDKKPQEDTNILGYFKPPFLSGSGNYTYYAIVYCEIDENNILNFRGCCDIIPENHLVCWILIDQLHPNIQ